MVHQTEKADATRLPSLFDGLPIFRARTFSFSRKGKGTICANTAPRTLMKGRKSWFRALDGPLKTIRENLRNSAGIARCALRYGVA